MKTLYLFIKKGSIIIDLKEGMGNLCHARFNSYSKNAQSACCWLSLLVGIGLPPWNLPEKSAGTVRCPKVTIAAMAPLIYLSLFAYQVSRHNALMRQRQFVVCICCVCGSSHVPLNAHMAI